MNKIANVVIRLSSSKDPDARNKELRSFLIKEVLKLPLGIMKCMDFDIVD